MKETDMLNAWLWEKHRTELQWTRKRVGVLPTKELAKMYSVLLRWVDAIVIHDGYVLIIEAKIRPMPGAIGQLELYEMLFPETPEFQAYKDWPIKLILLCAMPDLSMVQLCSQKGIEYEIFTEEQVNKTRMGLFQPIV